MKRLFRLILIIFLLMVINCGLLTLRSYAAIPHLINYQGRLTNSSGQPLEGAYSLTFRIYDAETAGNLLWEEAQATVVIQKGIFSVLLGSVTNLNLSFDKPYFLEIKVGSEVMSPRQRITSAGYAIKTEEAEKLGGKQPSDYVLATDITSTPTANKAVKLDSNAKLPLSALKVYDSGWFAVTTSGSYTKTHNLGTRKVLYTLWCATDANGTSTLSVQSAVGLSGASAGGQLSDLTETSVTIVTAGNAIVQPFANGGWADRTSGYWIL